MSLQRRTTLVLHEDASYRAELGDALRGHGLVCISATSWDDGNTAHHSSEVHTIVIQHSTARCATTETALRDVRRHWPEARALLLVPTGDVSAVRSGFRAGAWDCMEESEDIAALAAHIASREYEDPASAGPTVHTAASEPTMRFRLPDDARFLHRIGRLRWQCQKQLQRATIVMLECDVARVDRRRRPEPMPSAVAHWAAHVLEREIGTAHVWARFPGNRMVVALNGVHRNNASALVKRCRRALQVAPPPVEGCSVQPMLSAGIAESTVGFIETESQLLQRARIALDEARQNGFGGTVFWRELVSDQPTRRTKSMLSPESVTRWAQRLRHHLRSTYVDSTRALVAAVEAKDPYTRAHSLTVAHYAEVIGKTLGLPARTLGALRAAALLHDVGKIGVPDAILTKPGPLTADEYEIVKRHPTTAIEILSHVNFLNEERPMILHHHERYDGLGYPSGIAGNEIPIGARIIAVADALDTMFAPRTYKPACDPAYVHAELLREGGRQFDPEVARVALACLEEHRLESRPGTTEAVHDSRAISL